VIRIALAALAATAALAGCSAHSAGTGPHPATVHASATGPLTDVAACKMLAAWMRAHGGSYPPAAMRDALAARIVPGGHPAAGDAAMASALQSATPAIMSADCYVLGAPLP